MASAGDEDLAASKTDGFKVGEKKTVEEYAKLGKLLLYCVLSTVHLGIAMDFAAMSSYSCLHTAILHYLEKYT